MRRIVVIAGETPALLSSVRIEELHEFEEVGVEVGDLIADFFEITLQ